MRFKDWWPRQEFRNLDGARQFWRDKDYFVLISVDLFRGILLLFGGILVELLVVLTILVELADRRLHRVSILGLFLYSLISRGNS